MYGLPPPTTTPFSGIHGQCFCWLLLDYGHNIRLLYRFWNSRAGDSFYSWHSESLCLWGEKSACSCLPDHLPNSSFPHYTVFANGENPLVPNLFDSVQRRNIEPFERQFSHMLLNCKLKVWGSMRNLRSHKI